MPGSEQARLNMVDCQLMTNGITDEGVIAAFSTIPRELFLPEALKGVAYIDEDLQISEAGTFLEPLIQARLIQMSSLDKDHAVLNIGDSTGYSSALLSDLVSTVVTLETDVGALDQARNLWDELDCCNIAVIHGSYELGNYEHAPYDRILINGSVCAIPDCLFGTWS